MYIRMIKRLSMEMFDVKEFINQVDVKRTCESDDCEFEVTEHAMNLYC